MKEALFQVRVIDREGKQMNVGPKMVKDAAEKFADAIAAQVRAGREKDWRDPIVLRVA